MRQCKECRKQAGLDSLMEIINSWVLGNINDSRLWGVLLKVKSEREKAKQ